MTISGSLSHQQRLKKFLSYNNPASPIDYSSSSLLGSGKYGKVYRVDDTSVKKECTIRCRGGSLKQAFREHVVGILQTLLVASAYTPHFPLHFDAYMHIDLNYTLTGHMFMENFTGSLQDVGTEILITPSDWVSLAFQILSGVLVLADMLDLTHNDLYPRNILVRTCAPNKYVKYTIIDKTYTLKWPFLAVITDFGIASSSEFMGKLSMPEVTQSLDELEISDDFGKHYSKNHILQFKQLPVFSRDLYTFLKWMHFGSKKLPSTPKDIKIWSAKGLEYLDSHRSEFSRSKGMIVFFTYMFSVSLFTNCGLMELYNQCFSCTELPKSVDIFSYFGSDADKTVILNEVEQLIKKIPIVKDARVHTSKHKNCMSGNKESHGT